MASGLHEYQTCRGCSTDLEMAIKNVILTRWSSGPGGGQREWRVVWDCGGLWKILLQRALEGCGGLWMTVEGFGGLWRASEGCGGLWRVVEGCAGLWTCASAGVTHHVPPSTPWISSRIYLCGPSLPIQSRAALVWQTGHRSVAPDHSVLRMQRAGAAGRCAGDAGPVGWKFGHDVLRSLLLLVCVGCDAMPCGPSQQSGCAAVGIA